VGLLGQAAARNRVPALVIFAPTACGKTDLLLSLFGTSSIFPFAGLAEVISADSMQVYRGLDIGTAKPDAALLSQLPHHLIDICGPSEQFTVGNFVRRADECAAEIFARGRLPVVAGGTGFYIRNFLCGLPSAPEAHPQTRTLLQRRLESEGAEALYRELQGRDPAAAAKIHAHDSYRLLRALEVCLDGGRPLSSYPVKAGLRGGYDFCVIILHREREDLYARIDKRVESMFAVGLAEEVQGLAGQGYTEQDPGMQAIGYREFFAPQIQQIEDEGERNAACLYQTQRDTRRYAKRQYTFVKGIPGAAAFDADDAAGISAFIGSWLRPMAHFPRL
jgi:tRNA dimethylallyltransferase